MDAIKKYKCIEFNDINTIVEELSDKLEQKYLKLIVEKFRQRFAREVIVTCDPEVAAHYATDIQIFARKEENYISTLKVMSTINMAKSGAITKANSKVFANIYENSSANPSFSVTVPTIITSACREIKGNSIMHWNVMVIYVPDNEFLAKSLEVSSNGADIISSLEPSTDNFRSYIRYKRLVAVYNKLNELAHINMTKEEVRSVLRAVKNEVLQNRVNVKMNLLGTNSFNMVKERCVEGITENAGKSGFRGKLTVTPVLGEVVPKKFKELRYGEKNLGNQVISEAVINLMDKVVFIVKSESTNAIESVLDSIYDVIIYNAGDFRYEFDFNNEIEE